MQSSADLCSLSLEQLASAIRDGSVTPVQITTALLERIGSVNDTLRIFVNITRDQALADAEALGNELKAGKSRGALHGIPIAIKDLLDIKGVVTTACSQFLLQNVAQSDSTVVQRLREAGMVVIGKVATHEWAWGVTTSNAAAEFGCTANPRLTTAIPGGSSGGSAAALAAFLAPGLSDTCHCAESLQVLTLSI
jgi:aspartyl-tRNA(Asn)/glutamyl-tRNA(Gln) amidotransferase subunit A